MRHFVVVLLVTMGCQHVKAVDFVFEPVVDSIVLGVPTVVRMGFRNSGSEETTVQCLHDPFLVYTQWEWACGESETIRHSLADLHCPIPSPHVITGWIRTIPPGETKTWLNVVPTPTSRQKHATCGLTATVKIGPIPQFSSLPSVLKGAREFEITDFDPTPVTGILGNSKAQAATMRFPARFVLGSELPKGQLRKILFAHQSGHNFATLMIYNRQLVSGFDPTEYWLALDDALPEIRVLRNYMFITHYTYYARNKPISINMVEKLRPSIKPDEPLKQELEELFAKAIDY